MAVIPSASNCSVASCPVDLGPACPAALVGPVDSTGFPVGCKSACDANLGGNPGAYVRVRFPHTYLTRVRASSQLVELLYWVVLDRSDVPEFNRRILLLLQYVQAPLKIGA